MKKLQKPKTLRVLCVVFRSLKKTRKSVCASFTTVCNSLLTYTTYKPSHHNHSITPLSNHHTIIILKSIELRNIYLCNKTRNVCVCEYNDDDDDILRRCVVSAFLVFFSRMISFAFCSQIPRHSLAERKKKKRKNSPLLQKKKPLVVVLWKEEISRRDFLFLFFRRRQKKKINSRQKNHHLQKRTNALWKNTDTHTLKTRERKRRRFFLLWYILVVCLFCVQILFARTRERKREDILVSRLWEKRERPSRFVQERRRHSHHHVFSGSISALDDDDDCTTEKNDSIIIIIITIGRLFFRFFSTPRRKSEKEFDDDFKKIQERSRDGFFFFWWWK